MEQTANWLKSAIAANFSWFYFISVTGFVIFLVFLALGRFGQVRLGEPGEDPEFGHFGWFAMLFSAGMGIGLLFWGLAEPMMHFKNPPLAPEGGTQEAAKQALVLTYFHWGLHAWGIYSLVALAVAYFSFRHQLPFSLRSCFHPLLGDKIYGPWGHTIDVFAVVCTMFGVATSLGFGTLQLNAGLNAIFGIPQSAFVQILIIAVVTAMATTSVVLGLEKGIKRLSEITMVLALALLLFLALEGPTVFLIEFFIESLGRYVQDLPFLSLWADSFENSGWQASWTTFYWGWWVSWAPFVGLFIARISRGRTIREFILGVLFAPAGFTFAAIAILGGNGLHLDLFGGADIAGTAFENVSIALFAMFEQLPFTLLLSVLALITIAIFFVTSSDSGSLIIDMLTAGGHPEPPTSQRVFWAITEGCVASILLLAGGLAGLQGASIAAGLPFCVIMVAMCFSLWRGLTSEPIHHEWQATEPDAPDPRFGTVIEDATPDMLEEPARIAPAAE